MIYLHPRLNAEPSRGGRERRQLGRVDDDPGPLLLRHPAAEVVVGLQVQNQLQAVVGARKPVGIKNVIFCKKKKVFL